MAKAGGVYPVGGGLWSMVLHPEDAPHSPMKEFSYTQDVYGLPEASAAQLGTRSNVVNIEFEMTPETEGVMYAILIMNALVPFINRATQPRVFGTAARGTGT